MGKYIKVFKGCSVLNTKQAYRTDSPQKCSEKVMSAASNIRLGRQHLLLSDSSQLTPPMIFFFLELGLRKVKIIKFQIRFKNLIFAFRLCSTVFRTKACSLTLLDLYLGMATFCILKCLTNIEEFCYRYIWIEFSRA